MEKEKSEDNGYYPTGNAGKKPKRKANKTQAGKNNYTFNNCTVTINEEGKAIDILQKKEQFNNMAMEQGMKMVQNVIELYSKKATTAAPQPPPAKEWAEEFVKGATKGPNAAAKKKAPVKKRKQKPVSKLVRKPKR